MRSAIIFLLLVLPAMALGQTASTEADVRARLVGKPLFLRCFCGEDKLRFDAAGKPLRSGKVVSWTVSGVEITKVDLRHGSLALEGYRVGLRFPSGINGGKGPPERLRLVTGMAPDKHDEKMQFEIAGGPGGDFGPALDAVFTEHMNDLGPTLPSEWQDYAARHLVDTPPAPRRGEVAPGTRRIGGPVSAPRVVQMPEPEFTQWARALKVSGNVLLYLVVDTDGAPTNVRILRPLGLGLDERAVQAVLGYQFKPAMQGDTPVRVEMNVEVNFQIF